MGTPQRKRNDDGLLLALASGKSVQSAAKQCGVCERTVYRRLQDPEFKRRLSAVRADLVARTAGILTAAGQKAVTTLLDLMKPDQSPAVRLGAAKAVLEGGVKFREIVDLEVQMAELQAHLDDLERTRHPSFSKEERHESSD